MPVSLTITDRKLFTEIKNNTDFATNTSDFSTHLKGNVGEWQKVVYTLELYWTADSSSSDVFYIENGNTLRRESGSFIEDGFSIGDVIDFYNYNAGPPVFFFQNRNITNITDKIIIFDGAAVGTTSDNSATLYGGKTDVYGLEYSFGIIPQGEVVSDGSFISLLDQNSQTYYVDNIGLGSPRSTTFVDGTGKGDIKNWITGQFKTRFVSHDKVTLPYIQTFEVEHYYRITPYAVDSSIDDAFISYLKGNLTFKYASKFDFRTNLSNPNTSKLHIDDIQLGSVGGFGESFDGYNINHTVGTPTYTDIATATATNALNVSSDTRVNVSLNTTDGIFTVGAPIVVYHSYLPTSDIYSREGNESPTELAKTYDDIWFVESLRNVIDGAGVSGTLITNFTATRVDDNNVNLQFDLEFTATEREQIEEGYAYLLAVGVADDTLTNDNDLKKSILLIDSNTYTKENNITGLLTTDVYGFKQYPFFLAPKGDLTTDLKGWIEDGNLYHHRFGLNRTAAKSAEIEGLRFLLVAFNDVTNDWFELQRLELDVTNKVVIPTGTYNSNPFDIEYLEIETNRGYTLANGDEFNLVSLTTDTSDATYQYYDLTVGFKMNWQDWIALPNADQVFFDNTKENNGLNNNANNYNLLNNYGIRVILQADLTGLDEFGNRAETTYNQISPEFDIYDFEEQDNDTTTWEAEIQTYDLNGVQLNADNLGTSEITEIRAVFTDTIRPDVGNIADYWGVIRIQEQGQQGYDVDVIATNKTPNQDMRLQPLPNETYCKIVKTSLTTITLYAYTNPDNLKDGFGYKISAELKGLVDPPGIYEWTFTTQNDIATQTFDPSVSTIGGEVVTWTLKNGTNYNTNTLSIAAGTPLSGDELDGTCQEVKVTFSTNNPENIKEVMMNNDEICNDLDLTLFTNATKFQGDVNPNLTSVIFPTSNSAIDFIRFNSCNLTGTIDLSPMTNLRGSIRLGVNPNLTNIIMPTTNTINISELFTYITSITILDISNLIISGSLQGWNTPTLTTIMLPSSSGLITTFYYNGCDLTGSLDLSNLTMQGKIRLYSNPNLTSVTFPSTSNIFTEFQINNCDLNSLDLSGLTGLKNDIECQSNANMTSLILPPTPEIITSVIADSCNLGYVDFTVLTGANDSIVIRLENNNMTAAEVNQILVDLDSTGWINGNIDISGTNAAPDGTSGGFDGLTAKSNLITNGWTVTTN